LRLTAKSYSVAVSLAEDEPLHAPDLETVLRRFLEASNEQGR
jgi:hypothetical protein